VGKAGIAAVAEVGLDEPGGALLLRADPEVDVWTRSKRGGRAADGVIPSTRGDETLDSEVFERLDRRPVIEGRCSSCARERSARGRRGVTLLREADEVLASPAGDVEVLWSCFRREETIKGFGGSLSGGDIAGRSVSVSESLPTDIVSGASIAFSRRARLAVSGEDKGEEELASTSTSE
jgi:hypothetical protein